jgi:hypothetical protein
MNAPDVAQKDVRMSLEIEHRLLRELAAHAAPNFGMLDNNVEVALLDLGDRVCAYALVRVSPYRTESTTRWLTFHVEVPIGASWKLTDSGEHDVEVLTPYEAACEEAAVRLIAKFDSLEDAPRLSRVSIEPPERRIQRREVAA